MKNKTVPAPSDQSERVGAPGDDALPPLRPRRGVVGNLDVLLVIDPQSMEEPVHGWLKDDGYRVEVAQTATQAAESVRLFVPRVVVVDLGPAMFNLIHDLRSFSATPMVILDRDEEAYLVAALEAGADDYVAKPPRRGEFLARVRAVVRRDELSAQPRQPIVTPHFVLDLAARRVTTRRGEVVLTPIEWRLVEILVRHPDQVVTQRELLVGTWGPGKESQTHYLRIHMRSIRAKLEPAAGQPRYFRTETGLGIQFCPGGTVLPRPMEVGTSGAVSKAQRSKALP